MNIQFETGLGHNCDICERDLEEGEREIVDNLVELENKIQDETMFSIIYIAGYIQRNNGYEGNDDTFFNYKKFGDYFNNLNRGGLVRPNDCVVQWALFCFLFFNQVSGEFCINFLINTFLYISEKYRFNTTEKHCRTLANIYMKNTAKLNTPHCFKESNLKVLKLS